MNRSSSAALLLAIFFVFIALLIAVRIIYSGRLNYLFLVWNLFLAWLPFMISTGFKLLHRKTMLWKKITLLSTWLIFFPNALYIITDLIHLEQDTNIPKWFDAILIFTSSVVGLIMAFISLFRAEAFLLKQFENVTVNKMIPAILFLGSFGVYLGRFLRWNSWDIVKDPLGLAAEIGERFIFPLQHTRTWGVTFILTTFFYLLYLLIKKMPDMIGVKSASRRQTP